MHGLCPTRLQMDSRTPQLQLLSTAGSHPALQSGQKYSRAATLNPPGGKGTKRI